MQPPTLGKPTVLFLALLALAAAAPAAPLSFYLGASLGGDSGVDPGDLDLDTGDFGVDTDRTWKVFGGLGIGRILGVEAAWHDFGTATCCEGLVDAGFAVDLDGYSVAAVAGFPLSRLRLFAKVGVFSWQADGAIVTLAGETPVSLDGEDAMGGVGVDLKLTRHLSVRGEWELFELAGGSLDVASVGVQYRF